MAKSGIAFMEMNRISLNIWRIFSDTVGDPANHEHDHIWIVDWAVSRKIA